MCQYMDYIGKIEAGQTGKLIPDKDDTTTAIHRRLGAVAELMGKSLIVNRSASVVYFLEKDSGSGPRRRGRRRKTGNE